mmetsp:Transcript_6928/g.22993  ORF Transcript_6928/g.22993 Transcript_6928/m.22993 type:complete len:271 (+) Transcript_6928:8052-8864(+)
MLRCAILRRRKNLHCVETAHGGIELHLARAVSELDHLCGHRPGTRAFDDEWREIFSRFERVPVRIHANAADGEALTGDPALRMAAVNQAPAGRNFPRLAHTSVRDALTSELEGELIRLGLLHDVRNLISAIATVEHHTAHTVTSNAYAHLQRSTAGGNAVAESIVQLNDESRALTGDAARQALACNLGVAERALLRLHLHGHWRARDVSPTHHDVHLVLANLRPQQRCVVATSALREGRRDNVGGAARLADSNGERLVNAHALPGHVRLD